MNSFRSGSSRYTVGLPLLLFALLALAPEIAGGTVYDELTEADLADEDLAEVD